MGKMKALISQNIDMLHQKAGSGSYKKIPIYELHGSYGKLKCVKCKREYFLDEVETKAIKYPVCQCKGFIKPKVVLFGESLPHGVLDEALSATMACDCFLMVGSSLTVSPANMLPGIAKNSKATIIFVNKDNTLMDELADIFLKGSASEIFSKLLDLLKP